ncbi:MAG: lysylphosphatidylglycerol synthase domain-containing protein [Candidatus Micrarchaeia archaeon]
MDRGKSLFVIANAIVLVGLAWLLFSQVDLSAIIAALAGANYWFIVLGIACYAGVIIVTAARYKALSDKLGFRVSLWQFVKAHLSSLILSDVTPGRVGYAYFAVILGKAGVRASQSARILGVGLAFDFLFRALSLAFLALVAAPLVFGQNVAIAFAISAATLLAVIALSIRNSLAFKALKLVPAFGEKLAQAYDAVHSKGLGAGTLFVSLLLSGIGTLLRGLGWLFVFNALLPIGFSIDTIILFSAVMAVVTGLTFIPLSIAGLGVQEGVGTAVFSGLLAASAPACAAAMLLCRAMEILVDCTGLLWLGLGKK